jgi:hypothetical protein
MEELLDQILVPRANGSPGLERVASFIEATLRKHAPVVHFGNGLLRARTFGVSIAPRHALGFE